MGRRGKQDDAPVLQPDALPPNHRVHPESRLQSEPGSKRDEQSRSSEGGEYERTGDERAGEEQRRPVWLL